mgnify:CR=1 FL=1
MTELKTLDKITQLIDKELDEFRKMDKSELIEEIYRLRLCLLKRNVELFSRDSSCQKKYEEIGK